MVFHQLDGEIPDLVFGQTETRLRILGRFQMNALGKSARREPEVPEEIPASAFLPYYRIAQHRFVYLMTHSTPEVNRSHIRPSSKFFS